MPTPSPSNNKAQKKALQELGWRLREYRKKMKISAVATSEAAGISRVTLYRIEQGEPSVAIGAYISVIFALGLKLELNGIVERKVKASDLQKIPKKISIADYKQLKRLAWQIKDSKTLSPEEALNLYERNWRHIDLKNIDEREKKLIYSLLSFFGRERLLV